MKKPNILFISVDQLAAKWLELLMEADLAPNLKKLKNRGLNFTQAFANNPICMPSRSSTITGKPTVSHEVWNNDSKSLDSSRFKCFPETLKQNGYKTGGFGKFHFEPFWEGACKGVSDFGFVESAVSEDMRYGPWLEWVKEKSPEYYEPALSTVWHWHIPENDKKNNSKKIKNDVAKATEKYLIPWRDKHGVNPSAYPEILPTELSQTSWICERSCNFIVRHKEESDPLFLYCSFVAPHMPCVPPREYLDRIPESIIPDPIVEPEIYPEPIARRKNLKHALANYMPEEWRKVRRYYFAYVLQIDDAVGKIMDLIDEDNTYVLFSSDHGDMLGDHGLWDKGAWHYDACVRVPMFLAGPGINAGIRNDLVNNLDIAPTFLELAGLLKKEEKENLLRKNLRENIFIESYGMCVPGFANKNSPDAWSFSLRSKEYRYTWHPYGNAEQFFDLARDPDETKDLSKDSEYADKIKKLKAALKEKLYWLSI